MGLIESHVKTLKKSLFMLGIVLDCDVDATEIIPKKERRKRGSMKLLLSGLDNMFAGLNKLKPKKSDAQNSLLKFGCFLPTAHIWSEETISNDRCDSIAAYGLPSIISFHSPASDSDRASNTVIAMKMDFVPFHKAKPNHAYYDVTHIFILDDNEKPEEAGYVVEVDLASGKATALLLPHLDSRLVTFGSGRRRYGKILTKTVFKYPPFLDLSSDKTKAEFDGDQKAFLEANFYLAFNTTMLREYNTNIIVRRGRCRATFTVPENDWKYFFKDRVHVVDRGKVRRIFHAVMSHVRHAKSGDQNIKTHYRGLRHFVWNGYSISIVMQGKHGVSQAEFNLTGRNYIKGREPEDSVAVSDLADSVNPFFDNA